MTGDKLFELLQEMPPEKRKLLPVLVIYWQNGFDSDSSGWDEVKDVDSLRLDQVHHHGRDVEAIVLE